MNPTLVFDLDGTLLTKEHRPNSITLSLIQALQNKGISIVLASGRHFQDVRFIKKALGLNSALITSNGAVVHDADEKELSCQTLSKESASILASIPLFGTIQSHLYTPKGWFSPFDLSDLEEVFSSVFHYSKFKPTTLSPEAWLEIIQKEPITKMYFASSNFQDLEVLDKIISNLTHLSEVHGAYGGRTTLEFMKKKTHKASGLQVLLNHAHLASKQLIAFGDGDNDVQMLQSAERGFLMPSAIDAVKEKLQKNPMEKNPVTFLEEAEENEQGCVIGQKLFQLIEEGVLPSV